MQTDTQYQLVTPSTSVVFKVATAVTCIDRLRNEATDYTVQYETGGRNALHKLLAAVYKIYHDAVASEKVEQLAKQLRNKLISIDPKLEPKKNAHMSNMLVRYVFKDPDAKQVSVYARCLRVLAARSPTVPPTGFVAAVLAQKGGYSGFTEIKPGAPSKAKCTPAMALSEVESLPTLETVSFAWSGGEDYRVLIAVHADDDDKAELKAVPVSDKLRDSLMVSYLKEKQAASKVSKVAITPDEEMAVLAVERKALDAKVAVAAAKKALDAAKAKRPNGDYKKLTDAIDAAKASLTITKEELVIAKQKKS